MCLRYKTHFPNSTYNIIKLSNLKSIPRIMKFRLTEVVVVLEVAGSTSLNGNPRWSTPINGGGFWFLWWFFRSASRFCSTHQGKSGGGIWSYFDSQIWPENHLGSFNNLAGSLTPSVGVYSDLWGFIALTKIYMMIWSNSWLVAGVDQDLS